jgi:hypothetical protein
MIVCEFCLSYQADGKCGLGLNIPKQMSCREFDPGIEKFCSNPNDFIRPAQIVEMAAFFGLKGTEMKKVKLVAAREAELRKAAAVKVQDTSSVL